MKLLTNLIFEPKGMHNPALAYSIKDTVMSADGSRVYFALQDVPAGTALTDEDYWKLQIDLSASKSMMDEALGAFGSCARELGARVRGETARASGNPVSFLPDAGSLLMPVTLLEPRQQGSGDPSPDNIRPFIGWDALNLDAVGMNLYNNVYEADRWDVSSIYAKLPFACKPGAAYSWSLKGNGFAGTGAYALFTDQLNFNGGNYEGGLREWIGLGSAGAENAQSGTFTGPASGVFYLGILAAQGDKALALLQNLMLVEGAYAPDAMPEWKPYQGRLHTVRIGRTVYGVRHEWLTGLSRIEWEMKTLDGTEGFEHFSIAEGELFRCALSGAYSEADILSDAYATCSRTQRRNFCLYANTGIDGLDIIDNRFTSIDAFRANLSQNPVHIVYKLKTPIEIQLAPAVISAADPEQVNTLYGDGSIEVEYVKPLHVSIEEHVAAALAAAMQAE